MRFATCVALSICLLVGLAPGAAAQQPPQRGIVNITGQLYRAQNDNHYTVFLVTPEGIIMSDPINRDFSRWLKGEIASRFKVPVRYVLYTHKDWDHASGGVVWADTAEFVGHRNMLAALAPPAGNPPLTADAVKMDANRNGLVERAEASGAVAERFALFDYNRDEVISGAELARGSVSDVLPSDYDVHRPPHRHARWKARDHDLPRYRAFRRQLGAALPRRTRGVQRGHPAGAEIARRAGAHRRGVDRRADDHQRARLRACADRARDGGNEAGRRRCLAVSGRHFPGRRRRRSARAEPLPRSRRRSRWTNYKGFERWDTSREAHIAAVYGTLKGVRPGAATGTR